MIHSPWKSATITIASDDDLSAEVDLEKPYETLLVLIPTLTSANLTCYVSETAGGTYYALGNSVTVAAGTGGFADIWDIGGHQHIKIGTSAGQAANRTFKVCGVRS
jgi:hypothetical protein